MLVRAIVKRSVVVLVAVVVTNCAAPPANQPGGPEDAGAPVDASGPSPDAAVVPIDTTTNLPLAPAPPLVGVSVTPNRSSVLLQLPVVPGAKDFRVFAVEDGITIEVHDNREHVVGATLHCAGLRQRNQCTDDAILPITYNNDVLDMPRCAIAGNDHRPHVPTQQMQTLEVNGIGPNTTLVVEAIDRLCPFPGLFGTRHQDITISHADFPGDTVDATIDGKHYTLQRFTPTFPLRTEAEIRAQYGSMILNGEGPNLPTLDPKSPAYPESPYIRTAQPAPVDDPIVLARAVINVSPLGHANLPPGFTDADFFEDFDDDTDQPVKLRDTDYLTELLGTIVHVFHTKQWIFYDVANEFSDFFVDRGQLNMVSGDPYQDSMSVQAMYPKRPVHLPSAGPADEGKYLHVTYEVQRNETPRRYENLTLCGSDTPGQTYDGDAPRSAPLPRPGFMNDDQTARTSPLGWNCLYLIPRGAGYWPLPGGDVDSHSDTSLAVTVVRSHPAPTASEYDGARITSYATMTGPTQEDPFPRRWSRQIDEQHQISGMWLDDQLFAWQRTRFDVYIRRDRVVIYVNGEQRICNDLKASPLTMAEGALGFWHVLYHTSAEFLEIRRGAQTDNPQTGQHHIMHNTPFADQRSYDNVGFRENVALPAGFVPARCY